MIRCVEAKAGEGSMRVLGFVTLAVLVSSAAAPAVAQNVCQNRWVERNSIYKTAGCRFKTARAIRYFGNDGCSNSTSETSAVACRARAGGADHRRGARLRLQISQVQGVDRAALA